MNRVIFQGDVLEKLAEMDKASIDCIISSPPYWGLRDYGISGQLGLEPDFRDYLKTMNDIMVQLKRVLKNTGTCWINLGDTYGYNSGKSRYAIPERFYINCIDDGWIARNHIPWYKANSMPSSVKDRFTNKWESIFFFAKQQKYYFDLDSVREQLLGKESKPFNVRVRDSPKGKYGSLFSATEDEITNHNSKGERKILNIGGIINEKYKEIPQSNVARLHRNRPGNPNNRKEGKADWESGFDEDGNCYGCGKPKSKHRSGHDKNINNGDTAEFTPCNTKGKNPGDVFFINPRPFPEAHFATFPVDLPTKILKCACPNQVCNKCGKPRYPISKPTEAYQKIIDQKSWSSQDTLKLGNALTTTKNKSVSAEYEITGYTDCGCNAGFKPGIVLDPFFGSGTVGIAAEKLGLRWCGIELNEEYIKMAKKRLSPYQNESGWMFT